MQNNLENRISMYYKVREFFTNHLTTLSATASGLAAPVGTFNTQLTALEAFIMTTEVNNTGYAVQKLVARTQMRDLALNISGALYAHALLTANNTLSGKAYTTKSTLDRKRDSDILLWCEILKSLANAAAAPLIPLGITAAMQTDFANSILAYRDILQEPADKRSESKAALESAFAQTYIIGDTLKIIDGIMLAISSSHSMLYLQYQADRLIDDNAGGIGSPDVVEIIEAGNVENIFNIPYLAGRSFKLKNKGTVDLKWGLSTDPATPTSPLQLITAGSISTKQSDTLAPDGDFLLVQNANPTDAEVELTIIE